MRLKFSIFCFFSFSSFFVILLVLLMFWKEFVLNSLTFEISSFSVRAMQTVIHNFLGGTFDKWANHVFVYMDCMFMYFKTHIMFYLFFLVRELLFHFDYDFVIRPGATRAIVVPEYHIFGNTEVWDHQVDTRWSGVVSGL